MGFPPTLRNLSTTMTLRGIHLFKQCLREAACVKTMPKPRQSFPAMRRSYCSKTCATGAMLGLVLVATGWAQTPESIGPFPSESVELNNATGSQPLPPPASWPAEGPAEVINTRQPVVADIHIFGNETISTDKVYSYIRTRKGRMFDAEILQQDKSNLMTKGMFRDVLIATQQTAHGIVVTFEVFERPTIHYIVFLGDRGIGEKTLRKEIGLKEKDALNLYAVEEARRKLEDLYRRKGYPKAQVMVTEGNRTEDRGVVFAISEGPLQRIKSVDFVGNSDIASDSRLKTQIESKPGYLRFLFGGKLDQDKITADKDKLTAYYRSLGFFRARVGCIPTFDEQNSWVSLTFVIDEGPRYVVRNVSVVGNQKFTSDELMQRLQLSAGNYFRLEQMQSDVNTLKDLYGGQGHIFADIEASPRFLEEPGELDLVYDIAEGEQFRVGKINVKIAGEFPHTKEKVILDRLSIRPGQIVDIREIRNSERRLKASQLFIVNPTEGNPPQIVIVPPDLQDAKEVLAGGNKKGSYRGQSPDDDKTLIDLDVYVPRLKQR
jgi:outer membrane protein insertion porin family